MTDKKSDAKPPRNTQGHFLPGPATAGPGRPKGSRNATTLTLKDALMESFWQAGGIAWLVKLSAENPELYTRLLMRVLPQEPPEGAESGQTITIIGGFQPSTHDETPTQEQHP